MKIVCLGDSLTFGYGVHPRENWINLLNKANHHEFINKGINGDTTGGMLSRFQKDVVEEKPASVFLMGGLNDFITGGDLGMVKSNLMAMVHQAYHNGIRPIVGIPFMGDPAKIREDWRKLTDFESVKELASAYREWILLFCSVFQVSCIDLFDIFTDEYAAADDREYFLDGLHPNSSGQKIIADKIGKFFIIS